MLLSTTAWSATMSELNYQDSDAGTPAYRTRILVTPEYLRMDMGGDDDNFALLNRVTGQLYNVMRDEHKAYRYDTKKLVIKHIKPWQLSQKSTQISANTRQFDWSVNGKLCGQITATHKLQPDTVLALQQYWQALAANQWQTWQRTPVDMRDPCELARYVLNIPYVFQAGLPLSDVSTNGHSRQYQSDSIMPLQAALFVLPKGMDVSVVSVQK
jgi:hypothetical protein